VVPAGAEDADPAAAAPLPLSLPHRDIPLHAHRHHPLQEELLQRREW
jgi:hypothetical protein